MATSDPDAERWYGKPGAPGPTRITYSFAKQLDGDNGFSRPMENANHRAAFRAAFDEWAKVLDIEFVQVNAYAQADIEVGWTFIDGLLGTLGQTGRVMGNRGLDFAFVQMDLYEEWRMEKGFIENERWWQVNFFITAVHEIGHAIGLDHSDNPGAVMFAEYNKSTHLTAADIRDALALYAPGDAGSPRTDDVLVGDAGRNVMVSDEDAHQLRGKDGADGLFGEGGDDELRGGDGRDRLRGGQGEDLLKGMRGDDDLKGGGGADVLAGGRGDDRLAGGHGRDELRGGRGADEFVLDDGGGRDVAMDYKHGRDMIVVLSGARLFEDLEVVARGDDTVIKDPSGARLVLLGVDADDIGAEDFAFIF